MDLTSLSAQQVQRLKPWLLLEWHFQMVETCPRKVSYAYWKFRERQLPYCVRTFFPYASDVHTRASDLYYGEEIFPSYSALSPNNRRVYVVKVFLELVASSASKRLLMEVPDFCLVYLRELWIDIRSFPTFPILCVKIHFTVLRQPLKYSNLMAETLRERFNIALKIYRQQRNNRLENN